MGRVSGTVWSGLSVKYSAGLSSCLPFPVSLSGFLDQSVEKDSEAKSGSTRKKTVID